MIDRDILSDVIKWVLRLSSVKSDLKRLEHENGTGYQINNSEFELRTLGRPFKY